MKLSVIVPCYNEEKDIRKKAETAISFLNGLNVPYELLLVNDGSKDHTMEAISDIPGATGIGYEKNRGKGGAVKFGIEHSTGDYAVFMDADLSTDLDAFKSLIPYLGEYDMVIGSRHAKGSVIPIKQPFKRRFIGWCCRKIVNFRFGFHYKDTQCGFKAIKTTLAKEMVSRQIINGFAFDVEYLYMAKLNDMKVKEMPITWRDDRGSTVSAFKSSVRFFKDIGIMKRNKANYRFDSPKGE